MSGRVSTLRRLVSEHGLGGTLKRLISYSKWKLGGSPVDDGVPSFEQWRTVYQRNGPETVGDSTFSVVCPVYNTRPDILAECIASVASQTYKGWELILVDDGSTDPETLRQLEASGRSDARITTVTLPENSGIAAATNAGIAASSGDYVLFLDHDDRLDPTALAWVSTCTPHADLVYSDEDQIEPQGSHRSPFFKPSWSPRLLLGVNYVNHLTCVRKSLLDEIGGVRPDLDGVQDHDLLLRLSELPLTVAHIPNILYHWRIWPGALSADPRSRLAVEARGIRMIDEAIKRRGWNAHAGLGAGMPFNYRVFFEPEPEPPSVKVVLPTRDRLPLLRRAVEGVLNRTDGVMVHLVIVDNGSRKASTLQFLQDLSERDDVTILRIDDAFNFSRLCNRGAATGPDTELTLFLNNDVEVFHRHWLLQLTGWLRDPAVGAVGPKLRFPDGTIQHGGVIVGLGGIAGHYAGYQLDEPRTGNLHDQAREVGALTAACLVVRSRDFEEIGGMTEHLAVDFQDVDLCLRIRRDLQKVLVYDPTYPLTHLESASRGKLGAASEYTAARMKMLWGPDLEAYDPYYSPHLTRARHDLSLARIPSSAKDRQGRILPRFTSG